MRIVSFVFVRARRGRHTARDGGAAPRPAGFATPGPAVKDEGIPPGVLFPSLALGSAGGGDSTESEMICAPRTIVKPNVRFSSLSTVCPPDPVAAAFVCLLLTRRNSSVSARTRFMCCVTCQPCLNARAGSIAYLIEGEHLTSHGSPVIESDAHPPVDLEQCQRSIPKQRAP
jgi:hypothetical protein